MIKLIPTFILIGLSQLTLAQSNIVRGLTVYDGNGSIVSEANIELFDSNFNVVRNLTSNLEGSYKIENLPIGKYHIKATKNGFRALPYATFFTIENDDSLTINLKIREPCKGELSHGVCPYCSSKEKTSLISPNTVLSINFSTIRRSVKYDKKIRRKGYESTNIDDDELIISMFIESEKENFEDPCYNWFCKKCKKVFK